MKYRIYYADGATYSGDPFLAPASGVQAVAVEDGDGFNVRASRDYYCLRPDVGWFSTDIGGMWDYIITHRGPKAILLGRYIRNEEYYKAIDRANKEGLG